MILVWSCCWTTGGGSMLAMPLSAAMASEISQIAYPAYLKRPRRQTGSCDCADEAHWCLLLTMVVHPVPPGLLKTCRSPPPRDCKSFPSL
ncbi:hypothetical protein F5X68DRAFT_212632 [Plectosphaerella plurivora]|uniref:Secreted protein n=1 Tax=Plectosphaerella plurivora TaxID=936078 RepID=A0A9P8V629_9PEZI|nr:hypothetical protein F5X68DRAFT_212632 [Plectosphaerella plurivora]